MRRGPALGGRSAHAQSKKIDLRTKDGAEAVKGQWRYHDVKIIEVDRQEHGRLAQHDVQLSSPRRRARTSTTAAGKSSRPRPSRTPGRPARSASAGTGSRSRCPPEAEGKAVFFQTTVDDYGEVWVDGKLPRKPGDTGGPIVAGFNAPNRVELKDAKPGKTYQIAVFGINGPISATPTNWIFLGPTFLELVDKK